MRGPGEVVSGHPIQVVVRRTGLTADVLRAWEKRYRAVTPERSPTGRRFYSEEDIRRLRLIRRLLDSGRSIGQIAGLASRDLEAQVAADRAAASQVPRPREARGGRTAAGPGAPRARAGEPLLEEALRAAQGLDQERLGTLLEEAAVLLGRSAVLTGLLAPFLSRIGDGWRDGSLRTAHEHLATASVRSLLGAFLPDAASLATGPHLIATTPAGELHEIGALMVTVMAASQGWAATYLGPNLPAEDIAYAAQQLDARVVALSITCPGAASRLRDELGRLRRALHPRVRLLAGGRAAAARAMDLGTLGVELLPGLEHLPGWLDEAQGGVDSPPRS